MHFIKSLIRTASHENAPGGNRASREAARWTKPRRGERTGVSESIEARVHAFHQESHTHCVTRKRSRRESNPHLRFRKPPFYPLNYGNNDIFDFRFSIADCKHVALRRTLEAGIAAR